MKDNIRKQILQKRINLSRRDKAKFDMEINTGLKDLLSLINPKKILAFYPIEEKNEVDIIPFLESLLEDGLELYLPRIIDNHLETFLVSCLKDWKENSGGIFGTKIPDSKYSKEYLGKFDLILVPGIAFDTKCNRIGYGKGFYDKFLKHHSEFSLGIAYDFQIVKMIPTEKHDKPVSMVLTDKGVYR